MIHCLHKACYCMYNVKLSVPLLVCVCELFWWWLFTKGIQDIFSWHHSFYLADDRFFQTPLVADKTQNLIFSVLSLFTLYGVSKESIFYAEFMHHESFQENYWNLLDQPQYFIAPNVGNVERYSMTKHKTEKKTTKNHTIHFNIVVLFCILCVEHIQCGQNIYVRKPGEARNTAYKNGEAIKCELILRL